MSPDRSTTRPLPAPWPPAPKPPTPSNSAPAYTRLQPELIADSDELDSKYPPDDLGVGGFIVVDNSVSQSTNLRPRNCRMCFLEMVREPVGRPRELGHDVLCCPFGPVSYTHLTLPTIL